MQFSENAPRVRKSFSKIPGILEIPNLIEIQKQSFERFLQTAIEPEKRENTGLQAVFSSIFPIKDFNDTASLEFVGYVLEEPKYDVQECLQRGMTYAAPFKVTIRLVAWDDAEGSQTIRDVKEQEVYFGEIPIMTDNGTFIINGTERVIVSQLHRSPGIFFDTSTSTTISAAGKKIFSCRVIPYRGSWLDLEFDHKDLLYARIDRRRKLFATVLLKALGYSTEELLDYFYKPETIRVEMDGKKPCYRKQVVPELLEGQRATVDVKDAAGTVLVRKDRKFNKASLRRMAEAGVEWIPIGLEDLIRQDAVKRVSPVDLVDEETGEVIIECNQELSQEHLDKFQEREIREFKLLYLDPILTGTAVRDTLLADKITTQDEAIIEIYRRLRPGDPPTVDTATALFYNLFFNPERYDLSRVGRLKLNHKLSFDPDERVSWKPTGQSGPTEEIAVRELPTLRRDDILAAVKYLVDLKNGSDPSKRIDDIDHLGNRRVRVVGELLENQYRIGLVRMERAIKERMSLQEIETLMPHDLINSKPVSAVIKEFFGSSQLSQFMDQTNPLSAVTHKRRLSALGPGGLTRERAGFEVRDVHPTHYGRICPIETPEGPNIGLIASLSTFARVNDYGFIETPYRVVREEVVTKEVKYLSALEEERLAIAQANAVIDENGRFVNELVQSRRAGEFQMTPRDEIDMMDVSPNQLVSVAASLIPFLEHDDANRALMGSNMQRQAVPLLRTQAPLVGTGMEAVVARDSGVTVVAKRDGTVVSVDASRIVIKPDDDDGTGSNVDIINLIKYQRSNQNTCINQRPIVSPGDRIQRGQVIADGPATERGELALGCNLVVAFMPWGGYNFEDSILIAERVVKDDSFTSVHIEEFECVARDTKLGKEEITRDIPNVGEEALKDLDEAGIVRIGAEVNADDILVGKITPKGETQLSPEERLLRAIFGEKAGDVRDTSLRVPPGVSGIVIGAQVFSRRGVEKDERARAIEELEIDRLRKDQEDEIRIIRESALTRVRELLAGKSAANRVGDERRKEVWLSPGDTVTAEVLDRIPQRRWKDVQVSDARVQEQVERVFLNIEERSNVIKTVFDEKIARLKKGDELPPGVFKMVNVYVAIKRKLSVGDKMAGRHGNKGVISRILPEEDLPYMADGTPVDIVLNPLGVPSRMNVGQILETHLGWAARGLGQQVQALWEQQRTLQIGELRKKLEETFDHPMITKVLAEASDDAILSMAKNVSGGIHVATAVFDGADEHEIKRELERAQVPTSGQMVLFDGRTGEPFDGDVTVGVLYMLKLHHLADDKIHARSIGPYSLVTQQPLGGKAQFGGQRLGEMEVWAMEAYGAAFALQEFLTVKSDDVGGRTRMYESIVKGDNALEPGLPESFNVLVKELMALGLDIDLIEDKQLT
ncbi:DNA-directed RNA polymerase subunit beta [Myxococcota bacterium]|nr:DNA-directed RNA polymerase subunit beta [Myxococcota bacterium]MCZ7619528.1 DNA-directed RNA polymerase subunit beta [Myxococcota bacterium]